MCSKPEPPEHYRTLCLLMDMLQVTSEMPFGNPAPAVDYGWAGVRTWYGLLENA